ncbi:MAG TPA: DUF4097 family beta strand repeat-containing protein [Thermoanaerobaculia bacterium]|nr:DUF4097 family beta strand repeat-containing protein [Thermoanaerobaculia bacterium]
MRKALFCIVLVAATAAADVSHPVAASVRRGNIRRLIVDIAAGEISVRNGASDRIGVTGEVRRSGDHPGDSRALANANVEITTDAGDAIIRGTAHDRSWLGGMHTSYRLDIDVPRGMGVDLETKYGEVRLEGEFGDVNVDLRAGEIHVRTPRSAVKELNASVRIGEVHTDFGDDLEDHEGILPGSTHFINANGRSRIDVHTTVGELHVTLTK